MEEDHQLLLETDRKVYMAFHMATLIDLWRPLKVTICATSNCDYLLCHERL